MAILSFANQMTADVAAGLNTKHSRRLPQRVWTAARRRLELLHSAKSLGDLAVSHGLGLEALKYTLPGFYSIRVNDQYRIVFQFENGDANHVEIADYHGS